MTTESPTCPYCNAALDLPPGATAGQRILCPRCGDAFPLRSNDSITRPPRPLPETAITADAPTRATADVALPSRRSNALIASGVVGVMFVMAGAGLAFMLMTRDVRRAHDTSRPPRRPGRQLGVPEPDIAAVASVAPEKLAALGYLPAGVNFLAGARVPELLDTPAGRQILRDPLPLGGVAFRLEDPPSWLGLRLEDLDHLVFAAKVGDALIPPFYLVLRTAQPYGEEKMRQRLKMSRVASAGGKPLYAFPLRHKDISLHVWFADAYTLVLALFADQLESLPVQPAEDLQRLPDAIRDVLSHRSEPRAPAWIVGHSRDWTKTIAGKYLSGMKKEDRARLAPLRTFGIWLVPDKSLSVKGVFECADAAAAGRLEEHFRSLRRDDPTYTTAGEGSWFNLRFQTSPDFLSRTMKR